MKRKKNKVNSVTFGKAFHNRIIRLFEGLGMDCEPRYTEEGPDIIVRDPEMKIKLVVQCKATAEVKTYRGLRKLINEYAEIRREENADFAIIALEKFVIKKEIDIKNTQEKKKVGFLTDELIKEYFSLEKKIHQYAKYQILSDLGVFKKFKKESIKLKALRVEQTNYEFIVVTPPVEWLLKSASVYRRMGPKLHVSGYQRLLTGRRVVKDIPEYLDKKDWVLPNALVCATRSGSGLKLKVDRKGEITLPQKIGALWIIDGQHRLYSFANASEEFLKANLLTVIFDSEKMGENAEAKQADIFVSINKHARRVNPSLVLELLKDVLGTSDQTLRVVFLLYETPIMKGLIKTYTTQGGQIDLQSLASTPMERLAHDEGPIINKRNLTAEDKAKAVANYTASYFKQIKKIFRSEWGNANYIISDNRGIRALLRIFVEFLERNKYRTKAKNLAELKSLLQKLKSKGGFNIEAYKNQYLGEGGANELAREWMDFMEGFDDQKIPKKEDARTEFKETFRWDEHQNQINKDLPQEITKAICAFANTGGGVVFVGVNDDGGVVGLQKDLELCRGRNTEDAFYRIVTQRLRDDLGSEVAESVKCELKEVGGKKILVLKVRPSERAVYIQRRKLFVRQGAESVLLEGEEMERKLKTFIRRI